MIEPYEPEIRGCSWVALVLLAALLLAMAVTLTGCSSARPCPPPPPPEVITVQVPVERPCPPPPDVAPPDLWVPALLERLDTVTPAELARAVTHDLHEWRRYALELASALATYRDALVATIP